jgi:hypothetical protein
MNAQPNPNANSRDLENWELRIMDLEQRLQPIAKRPVDVTRPGWVERSRTNAPPLDEAGIRSETETLLAELIAAYSNGDDATRAVIRKMFAEYPSFTWASGWAARGNDAANLRRRLILFSMKDQERDSRDASLELQGICREAAGDAGALDALLREVAAMSSTANRYGMGSTRDMLLKRCSASATPHSSEEPA